MRISGAQNSKIMNRKEMCSVFCQGKWGCIWFKVLGSRDLGFSALRFGPEGLEVTVVLQIVEGSGP